MAARSQPFAHRNSRWGVPAIALGAILLAALAIAGHRDIVLILLAAAGLACAIMAALGLLGIRSTKGRIEDQLQVALQDVPAAVAITGRKGKVLWTTAEFAKIAGSPEQGQDFSRLGERDPDAAAAIFRLFSAAKSGKDHEEEIAFPSFNQGQRVIVRVTSFTETGKRSQLLIWTLNPSGSVRASSDLSGSSLDDLPFPAFRMAKDLTIEVANRHFEELAGGAVTGAQAWTLFRTRRGKPFTRAWLRDAIGRAGAPIPVQAVGSDGVTVEGLLTVKFENSSYFGAVLPAAPAAALDDAFDILLAQAPIPMALVNPKGVIQAANRAFGRLLTEGNTNLAHGELIGKSLADFAADVPAQSVRDQLAAVVHHRTADSGPAEIVVALKGREDVRVRLSIAPVASGQYLSVFAFSGGEGGLYPEQTAQSQKLQAVGELAGGIAHDFNNLLTAILGNADLLLRKFRASDPSFKDLMDIRNSATRAAELVKQILAYSRRQTLRPAILKFTDIIEEFQATMGRTLGENVKAKIQHGRDLWFVKADEGQLFQVVMNLAVNARDAMPQGGEITIRTANIGERESIALKDRGLDRGEYVLCEVSDTGTGIRPEHLEKIFDPFFSTKEVGKGTGLGLSTVYGIVKQTGGTILVDSRIGAGTTFGIYLPRYVETEDDLKALEIRAESQEATGDLTGKGTVLLVEDEDAVRSFASRALASRGYKVLEAASGAEALEIMDKQQEPVDLVVSDVVMPEMDGPTLLRHLRERNPEIRIVFMSGYAEEAFRKNLDAGEEFVFLPKPFTLKKLAETVKAAAAA